MRPDVLTLARFYNTDLGQAASQVIGASVARFWPNVNGLSVGGIGYCVPYLDVLQEEGADCFALMPAAQGVVHWPGFKAGHKSGRSALVSDYHLPLADSSLDRVLLVHAIEHVGKPKTMLRQIWRVLKPGGEVVIVAPNRLRTWSAVESTPFGHGKPYSKRQLYDLMTEQMLPPDAWSTALMLPPFRMPGSGRLLKLSERPIGFLGKQLGGALVVRAKKQVYGTIAKAQKKPARAAVIQGI